MLRLKTSKLLILNSVISSKIKDYQQKNQQILIQNLIGRRQLYDLKILILILKKYADAPKLTSKNEDLENRLFQIQKKAKLLGTKDTLSKDQIKLLHIHERNNHIISIADIQILVAVGYFSRHLSKCTRPACTTYCYRAAQRKSWRLKGKHNYS